ncbi:MAG: Gfo/Idh/MocA family oxidoreductase [Candidatus Bathyarchaeia archaeon]
MGPIKGSGEALTERVRIGLIGYGSWGKKHFAALSRNPRADLRGVYDPAYRGDGFFPSLDDLLEEVEAVDVVVPAGSLARISIKAMEAGKHVFIEKPMSVNLEEALKLEDAWRRNPGSKVMVGFIERFNPVFQRIREILRAEPPSMVFCQRSGMPASVTKQTGVILDLAIHDIDLLIWCLGMPRSARAKIEESFDWGRVELDFGRSKAMIVADCLGPKVRRWVVKLKGSTLHAHFQGDRWRLFEGGSEIPVEWRMPLDAELDHFISSILNDVEPSPGIGDGIRALEVIERGLSSEGILAPRSGG